MIRQIEIDPNVRHNDGTYAGFEHILTAGGVPEAGDTVEVVEPEASLYGRAVVTEVDETRRLLFLAVDWTTLTPETRSLPTRGLMAAEMVKDLKDSRFISASSTTHGWATSKPSATSWKATQQFEIIEHSVSA